MHDTESELTKEKIVAIDIDSEIDLLINSKKKSKKKTIAKQPKILTTPIIYLPITTSFIKELIKLDTLFRASATVNKPIEVFRGAPQMDEKALSGIVSTSLDVEIAMEFYKGSLIKINLPAGFPYLKIFSENIEEVFDIEKEIILPPCDYEVLNTYTLPHKDYPQEFPVYYNVVEVNVTPKNLAECFLQRMENPPEEYLRQQCFGDEEEFEKSKALLEEYVVNVVRKNIIELSENEEESEPE